MKLKFVILLSICSIAPSAQAQEKMMEAFERCFTKIKIAKDETKCLSKLFKSPEFDINYINPSSNKTYLHIAAQYNNEYATKTLLHNENFNNHNVGDTATNATALHYAANSDANLVIRTLLADLNVNPNPQDKYGRTPIFYTEKKCAGKPCNKILALKTLLESDRTDPNIRYDNVNHYSFAQEIATRDLIDLANVLYNNTRVDIHQLNPVLKDSLLHFAGRNNSYNVAKLLLKMSKNVKADLEQKNDLGQTAHDTNRAMFDKILAELNKN